MCIRDRCIDENGHLQKNIWREETYYGEDENYHKATTYYGNDGFLVINKILELDGEKYYFNQNGYLVKNQNILFDGIMSVSYTHLDVYKRQVLYRLKCCCCM